MAPAMTGYCTRGITRPRPTKCQARVDAERAGELVWDVGRGAYILTTIPLRHSSARARYYASIRDIDLCEGEPVTWVECPFCGGELVPGDGQVTFGDATGGSDLGGGDGPE